MNRILNITAVSLAAFLIWTPLQAQESNSTPSVTGAWSGTLIIGQDSFALTFNLSEEDGNYSAALMSRALGIYGMPADLVRIENNRLTIRLDMLAADYTGRLRLDESGSKVEFIDGEWFQEGEMVPIILRPDEE